MNETILVIEDDKHVIEVLRYFLEKEKYHAHISEDGLSGLEAATKMMPSLILLDVVLPKMNGFDVCSKLKSDGRLKQIPVIMLTERDQVDDRIKGLDGGADDYVPKPFNPRELMARVRARLRGSSETTAQQLEYGRLTIDVDKREVLDAGRQVELTAKEFELLVYLVENKGRVLTRDLILSHVWGYAYFGTTRTVDVHINHLRQKMPALAEAITTVKPLGYKLKE